ncbi:zinc-ribbon domain containing protein [Aquibacillus koreensis]|uniref:Zinc-ribbon domain containing protein n=1 Tax=Aquibacillus koreensis TaxID=279446 RepID=A0A9X4AI90_9BACI|nr:RQC-minor-1 family DNA-binding protein [Aquibacillus koreensis]MCT2536034.1 RQC-minor-1 family DNA-binding protein [Aquibacillus koreensis]MDC3420489.1 zinc-ribbon domain containing protein [Aquibacillus koreensis]
MGKELEHLPEEEIRAILRAADEIIMRGGRALLSKILKGSKEKKLLELGLDDCPTYGFFHKHTIKEITEKIDWMIDYNFLEIEYSGKLPMIVFSERGWTIEADQMADELLQDWNEKLTSGELTPDMTYLKDRNREMIFLFIDKIGETQDKQYIPYLEAWAEIEYKKVIAKIQQAIKVLQENDFINEDVIKQRNNELSEALEGEEPHDLSIKCIYCGNRFTFTIGEQQFYKKKRFVLPRRCKKCRDEERYGYIDM